MTVAIDVIDGLDLGGLDVDAVERDGVQALIALGLAECELSVLLCDDATIHPLNREWRGKDKPTDVLSFSQLSERPAPGSAELLGDILISVPTARRQADERGHPVAHEVRILLVHGLCHLLGHDHEQDDEAERMEAEERAVLSALAAR